MSREYPALDIRIHGDGDSDLVYAILDDSQPTALEEHDESIRAFFSSSDARDRASAALGSRFETTPLVVSDENWAERSQESLLAVTVGRITVAPPWDKKSILATAGGGSLPALPICIVIQPSMGFGTGHHATTRLCLAALQTSRVIGATVLDVGTGSGVLAIAADLLGASSVVGIDNDPDAIRSARETATLNADARRTRFEIADLMTTPLPKVDLITANLTGSLLLRSAQPLLDALTPDGTLIISGFQVDEREAVLRAFEQASVVWEREEDGWLGVILDHGRHGIKG